MNDGRIVEFRIGAMVLVCIILVFILAMMFGPKEGLFSMRKRYRLHIAFDSAPGVMEDTPVLKSGILVGRVGKVELVESGRGVVVTVDIDQGRTIYTDEVCRINRSLLGDSALEFIRTSMPEDQVEPVAPGAKLTGIVSPDPIQVVGNLEGSLSCAITEVGNTSKKVGDFVDRMNYVVGSPDQIDERSQRFEAIMAQTEATMRSIDELADSVNNIVGDEQLQANLRQVLQEMPAVMNDSRQLVRRLGNSLEAVDENLDNMSEVTSLLANNGGEIFAELRATVCQLNELTANLNTFAAAINRGEGTLGRLAYDPELYERVTRTARNAETLMVELRPIVDNFQVVSDKLARDPGLLGVRGALRPDPGLKVGPSLLTRPNAGNMMLPGSYSASGAAYPRLGRGASPQRNY